MELKKAAEREGKRIHAVFELVDTERSFRNNLDTLFSKYLIPMRDIPSLSNEVKILEVGISDVKSASDEIYNSLIKGNEIQKPFVGELNKENAKKADIVEFMQKELIPMLTFYKTFLGNTKSVDMIMERLSPTDQRDPFYRFCMEQQKKECLQPIESYYSSIRSRPVKYRLILENIEKYTPEGEMKERLKKEIETLKSRLVVLNITISAKDEFYEFDTLQKKIGVEIELIIPTRKFISKTSLSCIEMEGEVEYTFYLCSDLMLYGKEQQGKFLVKGRFMLYDSHIEYSNDILTIMDYEKCIYIGGEESALDEWYKSVNDCITELKKKSVVCSMCGKNCYLDAPTSGNASDVLNGALCRGCGRVVCVNCNKAKRSILPSNYDRTDYCPQCRSWNAVPDDNPEEWEETGMRETWHEGVVGKRPNAPKYYYNPETCEVTWKTPEKEECFPESSFCNMESLEGTCVTSPWLKITNSDDRPYYYNMTTGQTRWKPPSGTVGKVYEYMCIFCGEKQRGQWSATCPKCGKKVTP